MSATRYQHVNIANADSPSSTRGGAGDKYEQQLQAAQTQLEKLQLQREEIERKRLEAEELTQQRQFFIDGQIELLAKLDNSVQAIDRELFEMRQEQKEMEEARKTFANHLQSLQAMDPAKWKKTKIRDEVANALETLERYENDYEDIAANIGQGRARGFLTHRSSPEGESFAKTLRQGFAFNLPVIILGSFALLVWLTR
ncbi:MAG: hypothetical protein Q7Q71_07385 [Verrucomicrobiota bacterium JB023]|nr:hypothetical protein [Verrucomicrobiota bacterium JB023]